jgi:putative flippase GtrA
MIDRLRVFGPRLAELGRFVVNGVVATAVHYGVLTFNLRVLGMPSAGVANFVAAWFGIAASFYGSRYFVFRRADAPLGPQALRFLALYASIACLHGLLLFVWTDVFGLDYSVGFLVGTAMQMVLSYLGNKWMVFRSS